LTGTPGTGKTTIAKILSEKLGARHIDISSYALKKRLILGPDPDRDTEIADIDALRKALKEETSTGETLIIEGHYSHEILYEDETTLAVVLRRAPWKLWETLQGRLYSYEKLWENIEAEIMGIIAGEVEKRFSPEKRHEVDTSDISPIEAAEDILRVLNGATPRYGPIDWMLYPQTLRLLVKKTCTL